MFVRKKRWEQLNKKVKDLEMIIPKIHHILVKSLPSLPCGHFKDCVCGKCDNKECVYHPSTMIIKNIEECIESFLHF